MEAQMHPSRTTLLTAPIPVAISLELALDCLHGYLDCELGSLEDLLETTDQVLAIDDICTLSKINLDRYGEPLDTRQKLELAMLCLMRLYETVWYTPRDDPSTANAATALDNWLNSAEVILKEIIDIIYHSLAS
jgi:hypothetical protein